MRARPPPTLSSFPPRFHPDLAPSDRPAMIAMISARPMSRIVGPAASAMTSVTGWPRYLIE